jgi:hypothetical protein
MDAFLVGPDHDDAPPMCDAIAMTPRVWEARPIEHASLDREAEQPREKAVERTLAAEPVARLTNIASAVGNQAFGTMIQRAPRNGAAVSKAPAPQVQRTPLAIAARAATALASLSSKLASGKTLGHAAEAADRLGKVGGLMGSGVSAAGQAAGWLSAGGHSAGSKSLPREAVSTGDMDKLKVMAQYKIVNWACTTWVNDPANREIVEYLRNPTAATAAPDAAAPATPTTPPAAPAAGASAPAAAPSAPAVAPEADTIRDEVIQAAKDNVQLELSGKFKDNRQHSGPEYWWGEDDTHDGEESVGVSGRVYFTDVVTTVIDDDVNMNADAKLLRIPLPDRGAMRIRKLVSGMLHQMVVASRWDSLTISPAEPNLSELGPEGSVSVSIAVDWVWDGNTTASDHLATINPDGTAEWRVNWSGEPDDNSLFPSWEDSGTHRSWGQQEEFGGALWPGLANPRLEAYQRQRAARTNPARTP